MKPYYERDNQTIYNADCLEILKEMPDKSVDLVLTDPPYGIDLQYEDYEDSKEAWRALFSAFIPEAIRVAKMVILPSCQIAELEWIYANFPPDWLIAWYKGSPGHRSFIGFNDWEPHLVYGKTGKIMHDHFQAQPQMGNKWGHPCPKPVEWAKWFITKATEESDTILDPFLGSGTTLVACKQLGRKGIGIEISEKYCQIAKDRLAQDMLF